jgi:hypothetical protein
LGVGSLHITCNPNTVRGDIMPDRQIRIAFFGPQRAGKTSSANITARLLDERLGPGSSVIMSFADPVRMIAEELFGSTDRTVLISVGEALRSVRRTVFVDDLVRRVNESSAPAVIVDDGRFPEEWAGLKRAGFLTFYVFCPGKDRVLRPGFSIEHYRHPTEAAADYGLGGAVFDGAIMNMTEDSTLGALEQEVRRALADILQQHAA